MAKPPTESESPRARRTRPLREIVHTLTKGAFRQHGFAQHEILTRWATVVGDTLAQHTAPERLQFQRGGGATLTVRCEGSFAPELQHLTPLVIERINAYFGYRAIARLAIVQGPLPFAPAQPHPVAAGDEASSEAPAAMVPATKDPDLAAALQSLSRAMRRR
ncbi:MAG: DUF721 domain-containing protein [Alphaproteobacteria bacterium]|nr:DUF721 domain-containing protein [Alphaproteobacteria bacterium]